MAGMKPKPFIERRGAPPSPLSYSKEAGDNIREMSRRHDDSNEETSKVKRKTKNVSVSEAVELSTTVR